jgi:glycosyltransferase involved in cell wall biosynthesis
MKPSITFIASYPLSLIIFRFALMKEFIKQGYKVSVIAPTDAAVAAKLAEHHIEYHAIPLERNGINPLADIKLIRKMVAVLRKERPKYVFSYTIKPVIYGSIAAKLAGVPDIYSIITGTGYVFLNQGLKGKLVGFIARTLFRIALSFNQLIFFQNPDNYNLFKEQKIISARKKTKIINGSGVNCEEFSPAHYPKTLTFLMIARLLYDKGVEEYVQAARRIKAEYPFVKFTLVGWIDTNPNAITQAKLDAWIKEGVVDFLGELSDVRPAIADASVYVLPSYHEGTPRTVLEAMAMARPIITTHAPGCKETVLSNINGFLVPVKAVEELVDAMRFFILHPDNIMSMGKISRQIALEKYDVHKVNKDILKGMQVLV